MGRRWFLPRMPESLEQLDLLLIQEVRARKVRRDGIHFQSFRYLSLTLAAYVGEDVTIRYDPRDMGEIRVFYEDKFLCRAISAELAGETIPLRDIVRARNARRKQLRSILHDRQKMVDTLLQLKKGPAMEEAHANTPVPTKPAPTSSATETSSQSFVETIEHKRFVEFCDAVRQFKYIGLCYGPPGIGKTRSARHYSRAAMVELSHQSRPETDHIELDTLFYTTAVVNMPCRVEHDIHHARERLMSIAMRPLRREAREVLEAIRLRDEARRREILNRPGCSPRDRPPVDPAYFDTFERYEARKKPHLIRRL